MNHTLTIVDFMCVKKEEEVKGEKMDTLMARDANFVNGTWGKEVCYIALINTPFTVALL